MLDISVWKQLKETHFLFSSFKNCSWSCKEHFLIGFFRPLLYCLAPADQLQFTKKKSFFIGAAFLPVAEEKYEAVD